MPVEAPLGRASGEKLLAGKTALITGAGRNIGRSIALEMAAQGATVLFTDFDEGRCRAVEAELRAIHPGARGFASDVSRTADNEALLAHLRGRASTLDVLVNNVGAFGNGDFEMTYRTNILGPLHLTMGCVDMMIARGVAGSIIFVTSIHQDAVCHTAAYSSSKAALAMVIKELALELAPRRIRVNGIAPGFVKDDGQGRAESHAETPLMQSSVPPRFIGRAAVYLAADYFSQHTTGSVLTIDGGLSLVNYLGPRT
jgi:NAD(P)-dependent dehydrogenase (short-subunit alcohol dehydrogenase family)